MAVWLDTVHVKFPVAVEVAGRVSYALLLLLALLLSMPYLPFMQTWQVVGVSATTMLHHLTAAVFVLLLILSLLQGAIEDSRRLFVVLAVFGGLLLIDYVVMTAFFEVSDFGDEIKLLAIPLCALWIGWRMRMDEKKLKVLLLVFTMGILWVGLSVVFMQGSGFHITQEYFAEQKNILGPMLATAAVSCMGMAITAKDIKSLPLTLLGLALSALCVLLILTLRARAALLAVALVLLLMLFQRFKGNSLLLSAWGFLFLLMAVFLVLPNGIKEYVHQSLFSGFSSGDISSGRMARNQQAMSVFAQNPLLGHLVNPIEVSVVHNYPLWKLYKYGLLAALPMLAVYFWLLIEDVRKIRVNGAKSLLNVGSYALLTGFVVSMFEYTFPFGPGTSVAMNFILFGMALQTNQKK